MVNKKRIKQKRTLKNGQIFSMLTLVTLREQAKPMNDLMLNIQSERGFSSMLIRLILVCLTSFS